MQVLGEIEVDVRLTEGAKNYVSAWMEKSGLRNPILGISWGKWGHEAEFRWLLGLYDRDTCAGWLCKAPEFEFVTVSDQFIGQLNGRVLDVTSRDVSIE
jgi:hypothetical protein